jgi:heme exporter protein B
VTINITKTITTKAESRLKDIGTFSVLGQILKRDIRVALRRQSDVAAVFFFFIIAASLFPLGSGADPKLLSAMAPSVLWVTALLSCMLSLSRIMPMVL